MWRFLFVLLISLICNISFADNKKALIVAIGNYPAESGWNKCIRPGMSVYFGRFF